MVLFGLVLVITGLRGTDQCGVRQKVRKMMMVVLLATIEMT